MTDSPFKIQDSGLQMPLVLLASAAPPDSSHLSGSAPEEGHGALADFGSGMVDLWLRAQKRAVFPKVSLLRQQLKQDLIPTPKQRHQIRSKVFQIVLLYTTLSVG